MMPNIVNFSIEEINKIRRRWRNVEGLAVAEVLEGDGSPESYLADSLLLRELKEFGKKALLLHEL